VIARDFEGVPDPEVQRMVCANVLELYGLSIEGSPPVLANG
jgi:hypothetical protein